ncbi:hypothetical protein GCM10023084_31810 [Streptomyces lacrimifluminis]|uniref:Uncharacterized protein n=1 Tax=Streptomyces lacrimifluminis TaxID=1500077 RepID=A0A917NUR4_9ACTN|nr:hypothetical protein GCM10012282_28430 [Streptomyces lacrimifluminis]
MDWAGDGLGGPTVCSCADVREPRITRPSGATGIRRVATSASRPPGNGTTAPGKTSPPFLLPMSGSTYGVGSWTRGFGGVARTPVAAGAGVGVPRARAAAGSRDVGRTRMTRPLLLRADRAPQVAQAARTVACAGVTTRGRVASEGTRTAFVPGGTASTPVGYRSGLTTPSVGAIE